MNTPRHNESGGFPAIKAARNAALIAVIAAIAALALPAFQEHRAATLLANLQEAADLGDWVRVTRLVEKGAPPDGWSGATPHFCLYCSAVMVGPEDLARALFPPGAFEKPVLQRHSPPLLTLAVMRKDQAIAKILLEAGATPLEPSRYDAYRGADGAYLPETYRLERYERDPEGFVPLPGGTVRLSPLGLALRDGDLAMAELLLGHAAPGSLAAPNKTDGAHTLLHEVAAEGSPDALALLLDRGAPVDGRDPGGETALHAAARGCNREAIELLLARGADPEARSKSGVRPIDALPATCARQTRALLEAP